MRFLPFVPALVLLHQPLTTAGQVLHWANVLGVSGESMIQQVRTDALENVYVMGRMANTGSVDLDPGPNSATLSWDFGGLPGSGYFIAKYDSTGLFLWGYRADAARSIAVSPSGELVICAYLDPYIPWDADPGSGVHPLGGPGTGVVRWTTDGTFVSATVLEGAASRNCLTNSTGDVFLAGQYTGTFDADPGPDTTLLVSNGYGDLWVARLNAADELVWAVSIGNEGMEYACDLVRAGTDLLVSMRTVGPNPMEQFDVDPGPGTAMTTFNQNQGAVALRLDQDGQYVQHASFDWAVDWWAPLLGMLPDGGIALAGSYAGQAGFDTGDTVFTVLSSGSDAFIQRMAGSGWSPSWADLFSPQYGNEVIYAMSPFKDGAILVCGMFTHAFDADPGPGTDTYAPSASSGAAWIGSYCYTDGSHIWSAMMNDADRDVLYDLCWSPADALLLGGGLSTGADIGLAGGSYLIATTASSSAMVARYRSVDTQCVTVPTDIPEGQAFAPRIRVLDGRLVVDGIAPGGTLRVLGSLGQLVVEQRYMGQGTSIPMEGWPTGVYVVEVMGAQRVVRRICTTH